MKTLGAWVALLGMILLPAAGWSRAGDDPSEPTELETGRWSGYVSLEVRLFPEAPVWPEQKALFYSLALQPEYVREWDDGHQSFTFVPFLRLDPVDETRTHGDIRELTWLKAADDWELRLGMRKVFWGVAESRHLVDIINQSDLVESPDGEEKLGQPMANVAWISPEWGTLDLFWLPNFRERTFPGKEGRLRDGKRVDAHQAGYESDAGPWHQDGAMRWRKSIGPWDAGLSHFVGTSRDPEFRSGKESRGEAVWTPYYPQIQQTGLDLQATLEAWLWKLEVASRGGQGDRYTAAVGGFEYTLVGVTEGGADVGLVAEYLYDDRHRAAPHPFQDDIMTGVRLTMNDADSTDALVGSIVDPASGTWGWTVESSRRFAQEWKISLEGRVMAETPAHDPMFGQRRDHYLQLELARFF